MQRDDSKPDEYRQKKYSKEDEKKVQEEIKKTQDENEGAVALRARRARWTGPGSGQIALDSSVNATGTRSATGKSVVSS